MTDPLPSGAFLSIQYADRRRNFTTWRVYYEDGRVEVYDGQSWWQPARLTAEQISQIKQKLADCGVFTAPDLSAEGIHDTAPITWRWRVDDQQGQLVNAAYPAKSHPAMDCVMDFLLDLEDKSQ